MAHIPDSFRYAVLLVGLSLSASAGDIHVTDALTYESPAGLNAFVCFTMDNHTLTDDRLIAGRSEASRRVEIRGPEMGITVPAAGKTTLVYGKTHLILVGLTAPLHPGETVPVTLTFERAGEVAVDVTVDPGCEEPMVESAD